MTWIIVVRNFTDHRIHVCGPFTVFEDARDYCDGTLCDEYPQEDGWSHEVLTLDPPESP